MRGRSLEYSVLCTIGRVHGFFFGKLLASFRWPAARRPLSHTLTRYITSHTPRCCLQSREAVHEGHPLASSSIFRFLCFLFN